MPRPHWAIHFKNLTSTFVSSWSKINYHHFCEGLTRSMADHFWTRSYFMVVSDHFFKSSVKPKSQWDCLITNIWFFSSKSNSINFLQKLRNKIEKNKQTGINPTCTRSFITYMHLSVLKHTTSFLSQKWLISKITFQKLT
jgi:hypothetical protein